MIFEFTGGFKFDHKFKGGKMDFRINVPMGLAGLGAWQDSGSLVCGLQRAGSPAAPENQSRRALPSTNSPGTCGLTQQEQAGETAHHSELFRSFFHSCLTLMYFLLVCLI